MANTNIKRRSSIKLRIRRVVNGSADAPRISVFRSNKDIYAQLIDDQKGVTLLACSSRDKELASVKGTKIEIATAVGKKLGEKAVAAGITKAKFDRNGYLYHGRVKALAEGAREGGIQF